MPIEIATHELGKLVPHALSEYRKALPCLNYTLAPFGILNNENRAAHFLAQVLHESGGLSVQRENMNYTTAARIRAVWPSRFPTRESALPFVRNPEGLANKVYGGRMGNNRPGDGWAYRGRGAIQITGKEMYRLIGDRLQADFVANPDLVFDSRYVFVVAASLWVHKGCSAKADADDIIAVTKAINGGLIGLLDRKAWLIKTRTIVGLR